MAKTIAYGHIRAAALGNAGDLVESYSWEWDTWHLPITSTTTVALPKPQFPGHVGAFNLQWREKFHAEYFSGTFQLRIPYPSEGNRSNSTLPYGIQYFGRVDTTPSAPPTRWRIDSICAYAIVEKGLKTGGQITKTFVPATVELVDTPAAAWHANQGTTMKVMLNLAAMDNWMGEKLHVDIKIVKERVQPNQQK